MHNSTVYLTIALPSERVGIPQKLKEYFVEKKKEIEESGEEENRRYKILLCMMLSLI